MVLDAGTANTNAVTASNNLVNQLDTDFNTTINNALTQADDQVNSQRSTELTQAGTQIGKHATDWYAGYKAQHLEWWESRVIQPLQMAVGVATVGAMFLFPPAVPFL